MSTTRGVDVRDLLFPFALVALLYPAVGRSPTGTPAQASAVPPRPPATAEPSKPQQGQHSARDLLCQSLGKQSPQCCLELENVTVEPLIVTVPDPLGSELDYAFDRYVDAVLRATEAIGYRLDRFDLPWTREPPSDARLTVEYVLDRFSPPHEQMGDRPGILLLRHTNAALSAPSLIVAFLVGETPTAGVNPLAFNNALRQYEDLCRSDLQARCSAPEGNGERVRILGPSFSGSLDSVIRGFRGYPFQSWAPCLLMISGAATALRLDKVTELERATGQSLACPDGKAAVSATVRPALDTFVRFASHVLRKEKVTLLVEGNSGFAGNLQHALRPSDTEPSIETEFNVITVTFPLHISRLRSASMNVPARAGPQTQPPDLRPRNVPIPLGQAGKERSVIPAMSSLEASSAELVLSDVLSTISRERIRYVGIYATDVRDRLFLAREVKAHAPNTVLFTDAADLLYLHSDVNGDNRGNLVLTTYPLFGPNQQWTRLFRNSTTAGGSRLQFASGGDEGVYNAAIALLDSRPRKHLLDYSAPFAEGASSEPPLWLSIVGRQRLWPVRMLPPPDPPRRDPSPSYVWTPEEAAAFPALSPANVDEWVRDLAPPLSTLLLWLGVLSVLVPSVLLHYELPISRAGALFRRNGTSTEERRADTDSVHDRRTLHHDLEQPLGMDHWLYYLALSLTLLAVYLVVWSLFALPMVIINSSGAASIVSVSRLRLAGFTVATAVLLIVLAACVTVALAPLTTRAEWKRERNPRELIWRGGIAVIFASASLAASFWVVSSWLALGGTRAEIARAIPLHGRAMDFTSGVSPVVPLFLIGCAGVLAVFCSLRRLTKAGEQPASFLDIDVRSVGGVFEREKELRTCITRNPFRLPLRFVLPLAGLFLVAAVKIVRRWTPSLDGEPFDRAFQIAFSCVFLALLIAFVRFVSIWRVLRELLDRMWVHPMAAAFAHVHENRPESRSYPLTVSPSPFTTELSVRSAGAVARAGEMLALRSSMPYAAREAANIRRLAKEAEHALDAVDVATYARCRESIFKERLKLESSLRDLGRTVAPGLESRWRLPEQPNASMSSPQTKRGGQDVAIHSLVVRWSAANSTHGDALTESDLPVATIAQPESGQSTDPERAFHQVCERFLASRILALADNTLWHMKNLLAFVTLGSLLTLLAVTSYPFQPHDWLLAITWTLILTAALVAMVVLVQVDRNAVLSALSGTTPGRVTWNREFVIPLLVFVVVPILTFLGVQLPEAFGRSMPSMDWILGRPQ